MLPQSSQTTGFHLVQQIVRMLGHRNHRDVYHPANRKTLCRLPVLQSEAFQSSLRYLHATYFDEEPPIWGNIRTFYMTNETAFVVNLDRDEQRMGSFTSQNRPCMGAIQRYAAHQWSVDGETPTGRQRIEVQSEWETKYPFLKIAAAKGQFGDASCSLSHLLLWKEKLIDGKRDYIFVFEDDVKILDPLRSNRTIQAPDVADLVFLPPFAAKRVAVRWRGMGGGSESHPDEPAVRVIGGFGTMGYVVTRKAALSMLDFLKHSRYPLDISLFQASSLRVYLPLQGQWPAVHHAGGASTRLGLNKAQ